MSLNDLALEQIGAKNPVVLNQVKDELFNLNSKVKRRYDQGLSKEQAQEAETLLEVLQVAQTSLEKLAN